MTILRNRAKRPPDRDSASPQPEHTTRTPGLFYGGRVAAGFCYALER